MYSGVPTSINVYCCDMRLVRRAPRGGVQYPIAAWRGGRGVDCIITADERAGAVSDTTTAAADRDVTSLYRPCATTCVRAARFRRVRSRLRSLTSHVGRRRRRLGACWHVAGRALLISELLLRAPLRTRLRIRLLELSVVSDVNCVGSCAAAENDQVRCAC